MLSIFEKQVGGSGPMLPTSRLSRPASVCLIVTILGVALYITFFLLPAFNDDQLDPPTMPSPVKAKGVSAADSSSKNKARHPDDHDDDAAHGHDHGEEGNNNNNNKNIKKKSTDDDDANDDSRGPAAAAAAGDALPQGVQQQQPWGYNKERNVARWDAIRRSIDSDFERQDNDGTPQGKSKKGQRFVLVDYGSDAGYFSVNAAFTFKRKNIFVVSVEMGGVGGEIWLKPGQKKDVLAVQEAQAAAHAVEQNMMICQTRMHQKMFFQLVERGESHRYQLVLSVFHWFDLPTRKHFEEAIVALFKNAQTTFIELPTIGDKSKIIRKQVGWERFRVWYDNRTDIQQILEDAGQLQDFPIKVTKIVAVPWPNTGPYKSKWTRDVYRVDWNLRAIAAKQQEQHQQRQQSQQQQLFTCDTRKQIYGCAHRPKLHKCWNVRY